MAGLRHWVGTETYNDQDTKDSTVAVEYDASVLIISDTTIRLSIDNRGLSYTGSSASELYFYREIRRDKFGYPDTSGTWSLTFNYVTNKIKYKSLKGAHFSYSILELESN